MTLFVVRLESILETRLSLKTLAGGGASMFWGTITVAWTSFCWVEWWSTCVLWSLWSSYYDGLLMVPFLVGWIFFFLSLLSYNFYNASLLLESASWADLYNFTILIRTRQTTLPALKIIIIINTLFQLLSFKYQKFGK